MHMRPHASKSNHTKQPRVILWLDPRSSGRILLRSTLLAAGQVEAALRVQASCQRADTLIGHSKCYLNVQVEAVFAVLQQSLPVA